MKVSIKRVKLYKYYEEDINLNSSLVDLGKHGEPAANVSGHHLPYRSHLGALLCHLANKKQYNTSPELVCPTSSMWSLVL